MATDQEIKEVIREFRKLHLSHLQPLLNRTNFGAGALLQYLSETDAPVTAGSISERLGISTARVAVLLNKLSEKSLIQKSVQPGDARVTLVQLSEEGREFVAKLQAEMYQAIEAAINELGIEKIRQFITLTTEIESFIKNRPLNDQFLKL